MQKCDKENKREAFFVFSSPWKDERCRIGLASSLTVWVQHGSGSMARGVRMGAPPVDITRQVECFVWVMCCGKRIKGEEKESKQRRKRERKMRGCEVELREVNKHKGLPRLRGNGIVPFDAPTDVVSETRNVLVSHTFRRIMLRWCLRCVLGERKLERTGSSWIPLLHEKGLLSYQEDKDIPKWYSRRQGCVPLTWLRPRSWWTIAANSICPLG